MHAWVYSRHSGILELRALTLYALRIFLFWYFTCVTNVNRFIFLCFWIYLSHLWESCRHFILSCFFLSFRLMILKILSSLNSKREHFHSCWVFVILLLLTFRKHLKFLAWPFCCISLGWVFGGAETVRDLNSTKISFLGRSSSILDSCKESNAM